MLGDFNGQPRPVVSVEGKGTKDPLDRLHETVRHRILADLGTGPVTLNQKLTACWDLDDHARHAMIDYPYGQP